MSFDTVDDRGRPVTLTHIALHSERPDIQQLCYNGIVFPPQPEPWVFQNARVDRIAVTHASAWAGERCIGIQKIGPLPLNPFDQISISLYLNGPGMELLPLPDFARGSVDR